MPRGKPKPPKSGPAQNAPGRKQAKWEFSIVKVNNQLAQENKRLAKAVMQANPRAVEPAGKMPPRRRNVALDAPAPWVANMATGYGADNVRAIPFTKRESLGYVNGSVGFSSQAIIIQPGLAAFLPWLHDIAAKFERYRFRRLCSELKPTVSQFALPGQQGRVVLNFIYDSISQIPANITQAEETTPSVPGLGSQFLYLDADPRRLTPIEGKYVRLGLVPTGSDPKTYDAGQLVLSTEGMADGSRNGELWVDYDIDLITPILLPNTLPPNHTVFHGIISTTVALTSGVQATAPSFDVVQNNISCTVLGTVVTLRGGAYIVIVNSLFVTSAGAMSQMEFGALYNGAPVGFTHFASLVNYGTYRASISGASAGIPDGNTLQPYASCTFTGTTQWSANIFIIAV